MAKRIIIGCILCPIIVILGITMWNCDAVPQTKDVLTASELKEELQKKGLKVSLSDAVNIAEKKFGGKAIMCRLRYLRNEDLGYNVVIFYPDKASMEAVAIHGVTGEILGSGKIETHNMAISAQHSTANPVSK